MVIASKSVPGMIAAKRMIYFLNGKKYFFETEINDCFQLNWID